jgi:uncharacterized protein YndB with AHSA1/START domain
MLTKALLVLGLLVAGLLTAVTLQPAAYRVVRSTTIKAAPERVFGVVNDFRQWEHWSPWAKLDPQMKTIYAGPASGEGAVYSWAGNDDVGEGRMTILESHPNEHIKINLEFLKPFESRSLTDFRFKPEGNGTQVDWIMTGENDFMGKVFTLVTGGMDNAVGGDFEKGLAQMKSVAESAPAATPAP